MAPSKEQKNLYHGDLVKMSPVEVTVKSDVLESRFKGRPPYVVLEIDGRERNYTLDNEECEEFFSGTKGQTFTIAAEGFKDTASLTYAGKAGRDPNDDDEGGSRGKRGQRDTTKREDRREEKREERREEKPRNTAPEPSAEERLQRVKVHSARIANGYIVAYLAARYARDQIQKLTGEVLTETALHSLAMNIQIQNQKDGMIHCLPYKLPEPPAQKQETPPQPSDNDGTVS